ncbi:hypothetical protein [Microvirga roseola]|uniref:hypothetical protein n=1 Tax=Microvirga roseola TaxID=2883126 RepID=UPI001E4A4105|nr:hypothetical protein [Microvirga roseola]
MNDQIEFVARAFYDAEGEGQCWASEPEILKEEFRRFAREAIELLGDDSDLSLQDLSLAGSAQGSFEASSALRRYAA